MATLAAELNAKVDNDWKISIPPEYRGYVSSSPKVILQNPSANYSAKGDSDADMQTRMDSLDRLSGLLKGLNIDWDNMRSERLSRQ